jgi:hypothetical protein
MKPRELSREINAAGIVAVAEFDGHAASVNVLTGEVLSRCQVNYSFGGERLWSGSLAGREVIISCSWEGGVSCYTAADLSSALWERADIRHVQYVTGFGGDAVAVSTSDSGVWLIDAEGRVSKRRPDIDDLLCFCSSYGVAVTNRRVQVIGTDLSDTAHPGFSLNAIVCAHAAPAQFAVGTIDGIVVGYAPSAVELFRAQVGPQELAVRLTYQPSRGEVVALVKNVSTLEHRLVSVNSGGEAVSSVVVGDLLSAAMSSAGDLLAVIRQGSSVLSLIATSNGKLVRSIEL